MSEEQKQKSSFGFIKLFLLLLILTAGALGFFLYKRYGRIDLTIIERTMPTILVNEDTVNFGSEEGTLLFTVQDDGAGLDEVIVRIEQNGKLQEIFKKNFTGQIHKEEFSVSVQAKTLELKEGDAALHISAFDKSFWNNRGQIDETIHIDYAKPKLEILTSQHNIAPSGAEIAFFKAKDSNLATTGIRVGDHLFPGYKASLLDPDFANYPDLYFAFFALPYGFNRDSDKILVTAKDSVGNTTTAPLSYLLLPRRFKDSDMQLSDPFLLKVFDEILPHYYEHINQTEPNYSFDSLTDPEKIERFKLINETFRSLLQKELQEIYAKSTQKKLWSTPWIRPLSAAPTSTFGEARKYFLRGQYASSSLHMGVDLADTTNAVVKAVNDGVVAFTDHLGIYGNAVVIDHGFGFSTLYGHLSSIQVSVGDTVKRDQPIARTGSTGLAGGDHLHFEIRIDGVPVTPIEWWDDHWIKDHIDLKIQGTKDQLGAQAALG